MIALAPQSQVATRSASASLQRISDRLQALQNRLFADCGITTIYIGAGSSLAVLDHCLEGKDLVMRDLDIFVCLGREMTKELAFEMGQRLESPEIGRFSVHDVRPRRRGNPHLPRPEAFDYNAGFGFFMIDDADTILDLTVFHSAEAMELNGIMNVDKVRIRLEHGTSLVEQFQPLFDDDRVDLESLGVEDALGGYRCWQAGTADLANEFDVQRAPLPTILRIIRTFAKFSVPQISESTCQRLRRLLESSQGGRNDFHTVRGLIKILHDRNAIWELKLLRDLGGLKKLGGVARQALEQLFFVLDRFDPSTEIVKARVRETTAELAAFEHQMKLEGVV